MLKRDIGITFIGNGVSAVLSMGIASILARWLGPRDRGLLALVILLPSMIALICEFGQSTVNATFGGLYKERRKSLFLQTVLVAVVGGLVSLALVCGFFWIPFEKGDFAHLSPTAVWMVTAAAPIMMLTIMLQSLIRGVGKIALSSVAGVLSQAGTLVALVLLFVLPGGGLPSAISIVVLSPLIGIFVALWFLRDYMTLSPSVLSMDFLKKSLRFGFFNGLDNVGSFLAYRLNQWILAYLVPVEQVGFFVIAVTFAERLKMLPNAISMAFLPRLANELAERQGQVPAVFRYTMIISFASMLAMLALGPAVIVLLFGWAYLPSIVPFLFLLPGIALLGGNSVLCSDCLTRGKPKYTVYVSYSTLGVNVALCFLLVPRWGITGAAVASSAAYLCSLILWVFFDRKESGVAIVDLVPTWADLRYVISGASAMARQALSMVFRPRARQ